MVHHNDIEEKRTSPLKHSPLILGPVVRITPTLLLVSDPKKLPEIYHRNADKTGHYITGSFGETESLFNMRSHKTHASFRKHIAGPVCSIRPE